MPADLFTEHVAGADAFDISPTYPRQPQAPRGPQRLPSRERDFRTIGCPTVILAGSTLLSFNLLLENTNYASAQNVHFHRGVWWICRLEPTSSRLDQTRSRTTFLQCCWNSPSSLNQVAIVFFGFATRIRKAIGGVAQQSNTPYE